MSVSLIQIRCQLCDKLWYDSKTIGRFRYQISYNQSIPMLHTLGWCNKCMSFEPLEVLSDLSKIESLAADEDKYTDILEWRKNRISPPRCLSCAGFDIQYLDLNPGDDETRIINGFTHPGCGGELVAEWSTFRLAIKIREKLYAPEGRKIEKRGQYF